MTNKTNNTAGSDCPAATCSPFCDTPETDEYEGCINAEEWEKLAKRLECTMNRYKAAYEVAIYNLIGVAGSGHPGVDQAIAIADNGEGATMVRAINIVFDGPPGAESGRFAEVETDDGKLISVGQWLERPDGMWALRIQSPENSQADRPNGSV